MNARRKVVRPLLVLGLVVGAATIAGPPVGAGQHVIWQGDDVPSDLEVRAVERGAATADGTAGWAGIDYPGPVGPDGCADVPTDPPNGIMTWPLPRGEQIITDFQTAELCNLDGGGQELRLTGPALAEDRQTVIGSVRGRVYRASPTEPMTRLDVEMTDGRCFALGSLSGYPGDGTDPDDYVVQGWNYGEDPSIDCFSRELPVASTTTTSSTPDSTSTTSATTAPPSTTTTTAVAAAPLPAEAVAGSPSYAG